MIIEEYDESLFIGRFEDYKRVETSENPNGNFSYRGLRALFEYIDEAYEEENPFKMDVISLCCDYSEYKNFNSYLADYSASHEEQDSDESDGDFKARVEEEITDKTTLIKFDDDIDNGFIIQQF